VRCFARSQVAGWVVRYYGNTDFSLAQAEAKAAAARAKARKLK
jgi:hypothetical protein